MLNSSKSMMNYQYNLNKALADQNRNWQERMANSAHQREVSDLKKAGLNPVLSVTGGNGANTPTGSTASVSDGAGYASALASLEAAQINSATQMYMHTTPSANSTLGQVEYLAEKIGVDVADIFAGIGNVLGVSYANGNESGKHGLFGRIRESKNTALLGIENAMSSLSLDISIAKLDGQDAKAKRLQRKLDRLKNYYPKQWNNVQRNRSKR